MSLSWHKTISEQLSLRFGWSGKKDNRRYVLIRVSPNADVVLQQKMGSRVCALLEVDRAKLDGETPGQPTVGRPLHVR